MINPTDSELELLVNEMSLTWGSGLNVGTLYGDFALDVAKFVRKHYSDSDSSTVNPGFAAEQWAQAKARFDRGGASTWHVDPITKAVTKIEPHPLAKPEDWDRAAAIASRTPPNPTPPP